MGETRRHQEVRVEEQRRDIAERSTVEMVQRAGEELVAEVERLIHEGNVRRVVVKHGDETVAEFAARLLRPSPSVGSSRLRPPG
jgi:L-asparaginase/Glu-tRNA(Gln) amidotransferase subunit D